MLFGKKYFLYLQTYADKTSIEVCICPSWLQLFRNWLGYSLKMEAIFLVNIFFNLNLGIGYFLAFELVVYNQNILSPLLSSVIMS